MAMKCGLSTAAYTVDEIIRNLNELLDMKIGKVKDRISFLMLFLNWFKGTFLRELCTQTHTHTFQNLTSGKESASKRI